jgi:DMSO/TMAO reductase YedYZ molybdopterin-dependent catalytic subunit
MQTARLHKKAVFIASLIVAVLIVAASVAQNTLPPSPTPTPTPAPSPSPSNAPTVTPPSIPSPLPTTTPILLYPGKVTQYEGQPLSPISNVYENAIAGTQYIDQTTYRRAITGLVNKTLQYTYNDVVNHQKYQKVVTIYCVEGWNATILWEGILVKDLLQDDQFDPTAQVIIFSASDGFTTSLPMDYILQNNIMIAYKMNGVILQPEIGWPFMLVAQSQYGYKWIKWITQIEVSNDTNYLGYWESRDYPNNATVL